MIDNAQFTAAALGNTVEASLHYAMLVNDWTLVDGIISSIVNEKSVGSVRIFDSQGVVIISSVPEEVGTDFDFSDMRCLACHSNDTPTDQPVIFSLLEGETEVILDFQIIENRPECFSCHNPEDQILGLYLIEIPLGMVSNQLSSGTWLMLLISGGSIFFLVSLLVFGINRLVIEPVNEISKGVVELSASNLDYDVPVLHQDELGDLAESFNKMRKQLKSTYTKMEHREKELAILNEVALAATQQIDLEECMHSALNTVLNQLNLTAGCIYLFDEITGYCKLWATHGMPGYKIEDNARCPEPCGKISNKGISNNWKVNVRHLQSDARFNGLFEQEKDRFLIEVPLSSKNVVLGAMVLVTDINQSINDRTRKVLEVVGREIGVAIDNAMLLNDARRREQEAVTLYGLGTQISASLELNSLLYAVAKAAKDLLQTDIGLVGLFDERRQAVVIEATAGDVSGSLNGLQLPLSGRSLIDTIKSGKPIISDDLDPDQPILHNEDFFADEHIGSYLAVPLIHSDHILGLIEVMTRQRRRFLQRDAQLLMRLAHHVVVSIENAQLYEQLRFMATLEERDRLAGEIHDHLAQTLGYLNVKASITNDHISDGRIDLAQASLDELKRAAKRAYTDVREAIFNLRTELSLPRDFLPILKDYLEEYRKHYGVETALDTGGDNLSDFPPMVAIQLLRIIQETLTNIRKHAKADKAWIRFQKIGDQVSIYIDDDGVGFDQAQLGRDGRQKFGLKIMRERAESVGGCITIFSQPGKGTNVKIFVPLGTDN